MKKDLEKLKKLNDFILKEDLESTNQGEKLSARQRLALLFDDGKYKEIFKFVKNLNSPSFKDGLVCASGMVNGRNIFAYASEFSVQGGSIGRLQADQISEIYRYARLAGVPIVSLIESGGAKISDSFHIMEGYARVMKEATFCSGVIPQITCVLGHCIGAAAFVANLTDFIIMTEESTLCISGAVVNKIATGEDVSEKDLGGVDIHNNYSGGIHFTEKDDKAAIDKVRKLLEFLPANNAEKPPTFECFDPEDREEPSIETLIPEDEKSPFDIKELIKLFADNHNFFEIQAEFAPNLVIGFTTFGGITVGVAANQSLYLAGAFDANSFRKMARFVNFLAAFNIPLINFVDVPGAIPTIDEHKNGTLIHGAQLVQALIHHKEFKIGLLVRRCFGGAYCMINPKIGSGDVIFAYPSGMIGVMSDKATKMVLSTDSRMVAKIEDMKAKGERFDDPFIPASFGYIDDIIEPSKTRGEIINALKLFINKRFLEMPPKLNNNPFL